MIRPWQNLLFHALRGVRILLIAAIPLAIGIAWTNWPQPPRLDVAVVASAKQPAESPTPPGLDWFAPLWQRNLKQPPIPQEVTPQPEPVKPTTPRPQLMATFIHDNERYAHLRGQSGVVHMKTLDDVVDDYRVVSIEPGKVQLQNGSDSVWITLPRTTER